MNSRAACSSWAVSWRTCALLLRAAEKSRVPGGQALTVDRVAFAAQVTEAIESHPHIQIRREEIKAEMSRVQGVLDALAGPIIKPQPKPTEDAKR